MSGASPSGDAFARSMRLLLHPAELGQPVQDHVAADAGLHRVHERVVVVRRADQPGEHRALGQLQLRGRDVEVEVRRRADPVDAVREVHVVQVERQDLVLRVSLLHLDRQGQLLELALERLRGVAGDGVLHQLLRDRRTALHHLARRRVREQGADERGPVQRSVLVELRVLDRQDGLAAHLADVGEVHDLAVVQVERGEHGLPVGGVDGRALGEAGDVREVRARATSAARRSIFAPHARPAMGGAIRMAMSTAATAMTGARSSTASGANGRSAAWRPEGAVRAMEAPRIPLAPRSVR